MTVADILQSAQFVIDPDGKPTAAMLDIQAWQQLVAWINTMTDETTKINPLAQATPIQSLEELWSDFWPEDESIDTFIETVRDWRKEDLNLHKDIT